MINKKKRDGERQTCRGREKDKEIVYRKIISHYEDATLKLKPNKHYQYI